VYERAVDSQAGASRLTVAPAIVMALVALVVALVVAVVAIGAGSAWAAAPSATPTPTAGAITLRIGWMSEPDSLNPFVGYQPSSSEIWSLNYDQLTTYNAHLQVQPQLAVSWSTSANGLVWTFKIRPGVRWQDGQPLTAHEVALTYNYINKNNMTAFTSYTAGIVKVVALNDTTVQFFTSKPKADMLGLPVPILPEHIWATIPPRQAASSFQNNPPLVGSGPFQVVEWHKNNFLRLEANPLYWGTKPHIDEILFITYQNPETMMLDFKAGKLDGIWGFSQAEYKSLAATPGVQTASYYTLGFDELTFNCDTQKGALGNPVLRDVKFRQALNWAIDKQQIASLSYGGQARPADSLIPSQMYSPALDYHWTPPPTEAYGFDLAKAGQLLTTAGYALVNGVRLDKSGKPIVLRLYARSESPASQSAGKLIAGWFGQLGIKVNLQVVSDATLSDHVWNTVSGKPTPDYDMFLWGWSGGVDPNFLLPRATTDQIGGWNQASFSDSAYDKLFTAQQQQLDPQRRKQLVWKMEQLLYQQTPFIPLIYTQGLEAWDTSRWQDWSTWPAEHGAAFYTGHRDSYLDVRPLIKATAVATRPHSYNWVLGAVVTAVVALALAAWLLLHQQQPGEER
jgi:peptide/nickel transport system substrate-binding protein